jgi:Tol biopolymer transport system component
VLGGPLRVTLSVFLALAALTTQLGHSAATTPGTNGPIAFERLHFQNSPLWGEIFLMNANGTGVHRLTHPSSGTEDVFPDWSPDGSRIVFERRPPTGAHSIWLVRSDGSGLRRLTPACPVGAGIPTCPADDGWPVWSPDGKHLAFQRLSGALRPRGATVDNATAIYRDEIVVTDANGQHPHTLVWLGPWRGDPQTPSWSPDGKRLVFIGKYMRSKTNGTGCICRALYIVNVDGTGLRRLTPPSIRPGDKVDWSPDGTSILFRTHPGEDLGASSGIGANLYTIHPDGTGLHQLTHFASYYRVDMGSYSPDGKKIVFETNKGAVGPGLTDIFEMNVDGTGLRQITKTRNFEASADWGPVPHQG